VAVVAIVNCGGNNGSLVQSSLVKEILYTLSSCGMLLCQFQMEPHLTDNTARCYCKRVNYSKLLVVDRNQGINGV
jgi:hypothetical protein